MIDKPTDYLNDSPLLPGAPIFYEPFSAIRWLIDHQTELLSLLQRKPNESEDDADQQPKELSLSYLMLILWLGRKLFDAEKQYTYVNFAQFQDWVRWAGATQYALKRRDVIEGALTDLWNQLDDQNRVFIRKNPGFLKSRFVDVRLIHLKDDNKPEEKQRVVSPGYRRLIALAAWEFYGRDLWDSLGSQPRAGDPEPDTKILLAVWGLPFLGGLRILLMKFIAMHRIKLERLDPAQAAKKLKEMIQVSPTAIAIEDRLIKIRIQETKKGIRFDREKRTLYIDGKIIRIHVPAEQLAVLLEPAFRRALLSSMIEEKAERGSLAHLALKVFVSLEELKALLEYKNEIEDVLGK